MKTIISSIKITLVLAALLFCGYVLTLWGVAAVVTPNHGQAELVTVNAKVVGASNVGQQFTDMKYFWGRPSAVEYDGTASGGSNMAMSNPEYLNEVQGRIERFLAAHPYLDRKDLASELVTASGSGLDPHISPQAAQVQVIRVAESRGLNRAVVQRILEQNIRKPLLGMPYVNVVQLNVELDQYLARE